MCYEPGLELTRRTAQVHRAAVTTKPTQDAPTGTETGPTSKVHPFTARNRWMTATKPKITAEITTYVRALAGSINHLRSVNKKQSRDVTANALLTQMNSGGKFPAVAC